MVFECLLGTTILELCREYSTFCRHFLPLPFLPDSNDTFSKRYLSLLCVYICVLSLCLIFLKEKLLTLLQGKLKLKGLY